jgi:type I restriction enzyme S subunit
MKEVVTLSQILTFTRDGEWGNGEPTDGYSPALVVRGTDFEKVRGGDLSSLPTRYIRSDILERKSIKTGDTLIETAGGTVDQPTGRTVYVADRVIENAPLPLVCASFARFLRPDKKRVDPRFLFWKLQDEYHSRRMLPFNIQHTGVARFQYTQFAENYPLELRALHEQGAIASVLTAIDDKIELNRLTNKTLDATARAIFRDWFVDFGPTRAKIEGRAPYLVPNIWSMFPKHLDDDNKPKGWVAKPLDQIAKFLNGIALQKYPAIDDAFLPVIKIAQLRANSAASADRASLNIPEAYVVEDGDVLFSWSGSLIHRVWTSGRGALNQHLFKVSSDQYPKWFYFHWIGHHMPFFQATAASKATTMGHIQRHHLAQAMTIVADRDLMKAADALIGPLFDRCVTNELESRTLAATRDFLLPKLMSGDVRVEDAEKLVGGGS